LPSHHRAIRFLRRGRAGITLARMPADTLPAFLAAAPGALLDRDRPLAYAALAEESARLAGALRELGVRAGDRVALWLPNVPAWLALVFACARLGAIAVSVNTRFRSQEVADIVGRSRARLLCYWPGFKQIDFSGILAGCDPAALTALEALLLYEEDGAAPAALIGKPAHRYHRLIERAPLADDASRPDAGCIMFTTSGTTKAPKFVLHDQRTLIRHARDVASDFGYSAAQTKILLTVPLCGVFGFCSAMAAIAAGRPLVMYPGFDAREAARAVQRYAVTHTHATDEMIHQMLAAVSEPQPFPSVEFFGYGAFSPALADLPQRAETRGLRLVGLFGMSEVQALMARQSASAPLPERALPGGRSVAAEARVRARDPDSGEVLPHGTAGELEFQAPSLMVGYFENEKANRAAFTDDGWFRSSDLGYTTADGRFVFIARLGDALRLSGFLVSPAAIEDVLLQHTSVESAQVVGVDTPAGVKPVAFVIPKAGAAFDEPALIAHCAGRIAKFKVPLRVFMIESFPITPGANATKIQKAKLRELAQALVQEDS
jgi:fatty-acyl-CoA synthase